MGGGRERADRRVGSSVRAGALRGVAFLSLLVVIAACSPTVANETSGADRAKAAKEATKNLEAAENKDLGCGNVVTSRGHRATPAPEHLLLLVDAFAVPEDCWDKIVFTFQATGDDMPPGYDIEYREPPFTDPNGGQIATVGEAFLYLTFKPVSQYDDREGRHKQMYLGNLRLTLTDTHHTQLVSKLTDAEDGTQSWVIGLDSRRPFTVDAASDPPRVTVYIMR